MKFEKKKEIKQKSQRIEKTEKVKKVKEELIAIDRNDVHGSAGKEVIEEGHENLLKKEQL